MALKAYAIIMHINVPKVLYPYILYIFYNYCYHIQIDTGINSSVMRNVICAMKFKMIFYFLLVNKIFVILESKILNYMSNMIIFVMYNTSVPHLTI
jgi:hypothetical protein